MNEKKLDQEKLEDASKHTNKKTPSSMTTIFSKNKYTAKNNWTTVKGGSSKIVFRVIIASLIILLLLLVLWMTLFIYYKVQYEKRRSFNETNSPYRRYSLKSIGNICVTEECIKSAAFLMSNMNTSVDPCEDFYSFACGNFVRKTIIPEEHSIFTLFTILRERLNNDIVQILNRNEKHSVDTLQNVQKYYNACKNESLIEARGAEPLKEFITNEIGGWPLLHNYWREESQFDIWKQIVKMRRLNNMMIVGISLTTDEKDSSKYVPSFHQIAPTLTPWEHYIEGEKLGFHNYSITKGYMKLIKKIAILLKDDGTTEEYIDMQIDEMMNLEYDIAKNLLTKAQQRNRGKYTVRKKLWQIENEFPRLPVRRLLNELIGKDKIKDDDIVVVYDSAYIRKIHQIVQKYSKKTLANHIAWSIIYNRIRDMPKKFRENQYEYFNILTGTSKEKRRELICATLVNAALGMPVGRLYVDSFFKDNSKKEALGIIQNIRDTFKHTIETAQWMEPTDKIVAKEKINAIITKIGYPEYIMNNTELNKEFRRYKFKEEDYFGNIIQNLKIKWTEDLERFSLPVNKKKWVTYPAIVNAFYSTHKNQIIFPAGILQPPFYHAKYPKYLNYGGIGMVIGHEIIHGFDDEGRRYDLNGNRKSWWSNSTIENFTKLKKCFIDQYNGFCFSDIDKSACVNGVQTQGENIADNGGIKQAFKAYRKYIGKLGHEESVLPGLDLSPNQLFFVNYAQSWCSKGRKKEILNALKTSVHSPNKFRIYGVAKNSRDFAKAFSCKKKSEMHPETKCDLW
ncbi:hypothetical protein SNEBB_005701 [Seison nebaliae]|nr:hypothetical protein SNEBB_005701 [Seison nebaliae]